MNIEEIMAKLAAAQNLVQELAANLDTEAFDKAGFDSAVVDAKNWKEKLEIAQTAALHVPAAPVVPAQNTSVLGVSTKSPLEQRHEAEGDYGFDSAGEMMSVVANHVRGVAQDARVSMIEQTSGFATTREDGIEIPAQFLPEVNTLAPALGDQLDRFDVRSTNRNRTNYIKNEATEGLTDGLVVYDVAEGAAITLSRMENEGAGYDLHKKGVLVGVTNEDLADLPALESRYLAKAPALIRLSYWRDVINGNGVGKTLGFNNAANTGRIGVSRTTSSVIKLADVTAMLNRIIDGPGNFWLAGHDTKDTLMSMVDSNGTLIWKDSLVQGVTGPLLQATLAGKPIVFSEDAAKVGDLNDLTLINPAGMHLSTKGGVDFAQSISFYFDTDKHAFRWTRRVGGTPVFDTAYAPRNGGLSQSHVIGLNA